MEKAEENALIDQPFEKRIEKFDKTKRTCICIIIPVLVVVIAVITCICLLLFRDDCIKYDPCGVNATCTNMIGSYNCSCAEGYTGDPYKVCLDINECANKSLCGSFATCKNHNGGHTCRCLIGYEKKPYSKEDCTDINECEHHPCAQNAVCSHGINNFTCVCPERTFGKPYDRHSLCRDEMTSGDKGTKMGFHRNVCMPPYEKNDQLGCIYISRTKATWRKAKAKCEDMGAQLIVKPPLEELLYYITEREFTKVSLWIGGKHNGNYWSWLDRSRIEEGWNLNEPDIDDTTGCAYFNWNGEGLLNDNDCSDEKRFICEYLIHK